jgi:hypothetical protein
VSNRWSPVIDEYQGCSWWWRTWLNEVDYEMNFFYKTFYCCCWLMFVYFLFYLLCWYNNLCLVMFMHVIMWIVMTSRKSLVYLLCFLMVYEWSYNNKYDWQCYIISILYIYMTMIYG